MAQALGVHVIAHDPGFGADAPVWAAAGVACMRIDDLLASADIVSLHVPLVERTRHLIDGAALGKMKTAAILINTSRGGIVDETALAQALHAGRLGGAAIDVFAQEPLPAGSPLADAPNLILTPHIAGVTEESNTRVSAVIATLVGNYLRRPQPA